MSHYFITIRDVGMYRIPGPGSESGRNVERHHRILQSDITYSPRARVINQSINQSIYLHSNQNVVIQ